MLTTLYSNLDFLTHHQITCRLSQLFFVLFNHVEHWTLPRQSVFFLGGGRVRCFCGRHQDLEHQFTGRVVQTASEIQLEDTLVPPKLQRLWSQLTSALYEIVLYFVHWLDWVLFRVICMVLWIVSPALRGMVREVHEPEDLCSCLGN